MQPLEHPGLPQAQGDTSGGDSGSWCVIQCEGKPWVSPALAWCKSGAELLRPRAALHVQLSLGWLHRGAKRQGPS